VCSQGCLSPREIAHKRTSEEGTGAGFMAIVALLDAVTEPAAARRAAWEATHPAATPEAVAERAARGPPRAERTVVERGHMLVAASDGNAAELKRMIAAGGDVNERTLCDVRAFTRVGRTRTRTRPREREGLARVACAAVGVRSRGAAGGRARALPAPAACACRARAPPRRPSHRRRVRVRVRSCRVSAEDGPALGM
jgi:hypothetical protein